MNIFGFLNIKSNIKNALSKVITEENIIAVENYAKTQIKAQVNNNDLLGAEKKALVDEKVKTFIKTKFASKNVIVNAIVSIAVQLTPVFTQLIFNNLKMNVANLTEIKAE